MNQDRLTFEDMLTYLEDTTLSRMVFDLANGLFLASLAGESAPSLMAAIKQYMNATNAEITRRDKKDE